MFLYPVISVTSIKVKKKKTTLHEDVLQKERGATV